MRSARDAQIDVRLDELGSGVLDLCLADPSLELTEPLDVGVGLTLRCRRPARR